MCLKVNVRFEKLVQVKSGDIINNFFFLLFSPIYKITAHYNQSRYHGLNLHATFTKGTVEFRLFNSTTHAGEIKAYIQFCLAVCNQALIQKKASAKKSIIDNEKYAFRCWMLRLGLIGDEFKTCRLHLLKNLEGNSAYIMDEKRKLGVLSNRYLGVLDSTYWKFGFDYSILEKSYDKSMEAVYGNDKA